METQCKESRIDFPGLGGRMIATDFDGGDIVSDGGVPLIAQVDRMYRVMERFAECFSDHRDQDQIEHSVLDLVRQRTYGLCLGYEDLNDHDQLRANKLLAAAIGKDDPAGQERRRESDRGVPLAGKSTLNRLELSLADANADSQYCKIVADLEAIETLLVDVFLDAHEQPPAELTLDIDPTDVQLYGEQSGRHFQAYYDGYVYLPLYVFCGDFLLAAKLRPGDVGAMADAMEVLKRMVARIRERWPDVEITIRGDGHYSDDELMSWCEAMPGMEFCVGLPGNGRLLKQVREEQSQMAAAVASQEGDAKKACRTYKDLEYRTLDSWSRPRRVVAKVEHLPGPVGERTDAKNVSSTGAATVQACERAAAAAEQSACRAAERAAQGARRCQRLEQRAAERTSAAGRDHSVASQQARALAGKTRHLAQRAGVLARRNERRSEKAAKQAAALRDKVTAAREAAAWAAEQATWEGKSNVRFVVLSPTAEKLDSQRAYEEGYCPRGDMENRIKEQQLYLFADRLPCEQMLANQLRLYLCSFAYVLEMLLRRFGLAGTEMEGAQCHTIRERLMKVGAFIEVTSRRVWNKLSSSYPFRRLFVEVSSNLRRQALWLVSVGKMQMKDVLHVGVP